MQGNFTVLLLPNPCFGSNNESLVQFVIPKRNYFKTRVLCCRNTTMVLLSDQCFSCNNESMFLWVIPKRYYYKNSVLCCCNTKIVLLVVVVVIPKRYDTVVVIVIPKWYYFRPGVSDPTMNQCFCG